VGWLVAGSNALRHFKTDAFLSPFSISKTVTDIHLKQVAVQQHMKEIHTGSIKAINTMRTAFITVDRNLNIKLALLLVVLAST